MTSLSWCRVFRTVLLLMSFASLGYAEFNCTREGVECLNGGMCDKPAGGCICMGSIYTGYDCSLQREYIMQGSCLSHNPCQNGGTCYDQATVGKRGVSSCYCPYEFYGEFCEIPNVQNECFRDRMIVNINPIPGRPFLGNIFIQTSMPGMSPCTIAPVHTQAAFSLDPVRSKWQGYAADLSYNGTLCGARPNVSITVTEIIYTYDIMVQYDATGLNPQMDEVISFSCPRPNMPAGFIGPTAVLFSVSDSMGRMVVKPKLGAPVTISFNVDPTSIFTDLSVQSCSVTNPMRTLSKEVVRDGCPLLPFGQTLEKRGSTHVLTLVMHSLGRDPMLDFDCAVKMCTVSDTSCQKQPYCPVHPSHQHGGVAQMGADPHATALGGGSDLLSMLGMTGGGAGALDKLIASAGGGSMSLTDLMSSLGKGGAGIGGQTSLSTGSGSTHGSGTSGATAGSGSAAGGDNFMTNLMAMVGGGGMGSAVMNDLVFGGGGATGGSSGISSHGTLAGGGSYHSMDPTMMMMGRRRRDVTEEGEEINYVSRRVHTGLVR